MALKSIKSSTEYNIVKKSKIKRDFSSVLNNIEKLNRQINIRQRKYDYIRTRINPENIFVKVKKLTPKR